MPKKTKTSKSSRKATPSSKKKISKGRKDPDAPKRPLSAFMFYGIDRRPKLKEEQPDMPFGEIGKTLGAEWKQMPENEKKPYEKKAAEAKKAYEKEMAKYKASK